MLLTLILTTITIILFVIRVRVWFKINFSYWTRYPQIPSVKGRIFSGNLKDFLTRKTNFAVQLKNIYEHQQFQNAAVVGVYGLYKPGLLIREPALVKTVLIKEFNSFCNRTCQASKHDLLGTFNIFFARYNYWRESRLKLAPVFSNSKLKNLYPMIWQIGNNLADYLQQQPDYFKAELRDLSGRYMTDVFATTLLGAVSNALQNPQEMFFIESSKLIEWKFKRSLSFLIVFFASKLNALLRPKIFNESTEKFMRSTIKQLISQREKTKIKRNDLIDVFVKIKQEAETRGEDLILCMENLVSQAIILMTATFSTNTAVIYFALRELARNPLIQERLRLEILAAFLKGNGEISYESLGKLEYLQMVVCETIRMYPNLPILDRVYEIPNDKSKRFNLQPYYDFQLPDKMPVYISLSALHRDSKYWAQPHKFDPERFNYKNKKQLPAMTYLPYGAGSHMCLGYRLGMLTTKVALVNYLKNHFVRACAETSEELEFDLQSFVMQPKGGIHVEFLRDDLYLKSNQVNLRQ